MSRFRLDRALASDIQLGDWIVTEGVVPGSTALWCVSGYVLREDPEPGRVELVGYEIGVGGTIIDPTGYPAIVFVGMGGEMLSRVVPS